MKLIHQTILASMLVLLAATTQAEPAKVMLIGTFHFANPGRDVVKTDVIDVTSAESQQYLEALTTRLAAFKPTRVLLEFESQSAARVNEKYQAWLQDDWELEVNETYQLGFRIAHKAGLERVDGYDNRDVAWPYEELAAYAKDHAPETWRRLEQTIADLTRRIQCEQTELNLRQLLIASNDADMLRANKDLYLLTNMIGAGDNFIGADAAAAWWQRNFRMYALIQQAASPGERVIVIGGSGHIAILQDLLQIDQRIQPVDIASYW